MLSRKQIWRRIKPPFRNAERTRLFEASLSSTAPGSTSCEKCPEQARIIEDDISSEERLPDGECSAFPEIVPVVSPLVSTSTTNAVPNEEKSALGQQGQIRTTNPAITLPTSSSCVQVRGSGSIINVPLSQRRNVSFNSIVRVCLVPSRREYASMTTELYWGHEDYTHFKQDAVSELRDYWRLHQTSVKEAIAALYQPQPRDTSGRSGPSTPVPVPYGTTTTTLRHNDSVASFQNLAPNLETIIQEEEEEMSKEQDLTGIPRRSRGSAASVDGEDRASARGVHARATSSRESSEESFDTSRSERAPCTLSSPQQQLIFGDIEHDDAHLDTDGRVCDDVGLQISPDCSLHGCDDIEAMEGDAFLSSSNNDNVKFQANAASPSGSYQASSTVPDVMTATDRGYDGYSGHNSSRATTTDRQVEKGVICEGGGGDNVIEGSGGCGGAKDEEEAEEEAAAAVSGEGDHCCCTQLGIQNASRLVEGFNVVDECGGELPISTAAGKGQGVSADVAPAAGKGQGVSADVAPAAGKGQGVSTDVAPAVVGEIRSCVLTSRARLSPPTTDALPGPVILSTGLDLGGLVGTDPQPDYVAVGLDYLPRGEKRVDSEEYTPREDYITAGAGATKAEVIAAPANLLASAERISDEEEDETTDGEENSSCGTLGYYRAGAVAMELHDRSKARTVERDSSPDGVIIDCPRSDSISSTLSSGSAASCTAMNTCDACCSVYADNDEALTMSFKTAPTRAVPKAPKSLKITSLVLPKAPPTGSIKGGTKVKGTKKGSRGVRGGNQPNFNSIGGKGAEGTSARSRRTPRVCATIAETSCSEPQK